MAKDMMQIFTVLMPTKKQKNSTAFSLIEMMVVLFLLSLVTMMSIIGYSNFALRLKFKDKTSDIINTFRMAAVSADQSNRRYAVLVDFTDYTYTLYDVKTSHPYDRDNLLDEDIIKSGEFGEYCQLEFVQFDDSPKTIDGGEEGSALFVVGHAGWDYGGKVVVSDHDGNLHSIVISRMNKNVKIYPGDITIEKPELDLAF